LIEKLIKEQIDPIRGIKEYQNYVINVEAKITQILKPYF
jgi:hypothetical protein